MLCAQLRFCWCDYWNAARRRSRFSSHWLPSRKVDMFEFSSAHCAEQRFDPGNAAIAASAGGRIERDGNGGKSAEEFLVGGDEGDAEALGEGDEFAVVGGDAAVVGEL